MSQVNTVLGPIDSSEMGFTLSHEHITLGAAGAAATYPGFQDRQAIADAATAALTEAHDGGVRTIIDVTTFDLGRDIAMMQEVSRRSGVHAIPCTGNHLAVPRIFWGAPVDRVAALFIKEIEEGIEDSGVKAGIIKVASDRGGITENEEIILRAAARACNATGTRISTHTWSPDRVGEEQVRILKEEGVDLNRVYIGHSNDDTDVGLPGGLTRGRGMAGSRPLSRRPHSGDPAMGDAHRGGEAAHRRRLGPSPDVVPRPLHAGGAALRGTAPRARGVQPGRIPLHHPQRPAAPDRTGRQRRRRTGHDGRQSAPFLRRLTVTPAAR